MNLHRCGCIRCNLGAFLLFVLFGCGLFRRTFLEKNARENVGPCPCGPVRKSREEERVCAKEKSTTLESRHDFEFSPLQGFGPARRGSGSHSEPLQWLLLLDHEICSAPCEVPVLKANTAQVGGCVLRRNAGRTCTKGKGTVGNTAYRRPYILVMCSENPSRIS